MIGDPVGGIARQDAAGYFHAGRRAETLLRSQPGERHSCIEIQVGDAVAAQFYATNEAEMADYLCYLLDRIGTIRAVEILRCQDDGDARQSGRRALAHQPQYQGIEIWDDQRLVHVEFPARIES
jgi:hypothetical protein